MVELYQCCCWRERKQPDRVSGPSHPLQLWASTIQSPILAGNLHTHIHTYIYINSMHFYLPMHSSTNIKKTMYLKGFLWHITAGIALLWFSLLCWNWHMNFLQSRCQTRLHIWTAGKRKRKALHCNETDLLLTSVSECHHWQLMAV